MNQYEKAALDYAGLAGALASVLEWIVSHSGERLDDNPRQLALAKSVLTKAHAKKMQAQADRRTLGPIADSVIEGVGGEES